MHCLAEKWFYSRQQANDLSSIMSFYAVGKAGTIQTCEFSNSKMTYILIEDDLYSKTEWNIWIFDLLWCLSASWTSGFGRSRLR